METPDQYMHRAIKSDRTVAGTSADGSLTPLFPRAQARGCRPEPRRADARSTAFGFTPKPPSGGFSPPVPQGSGGSASSTRKSNSNPMNHNALENSC
jgi:hypothetical protein